MTWPIAGYLDFGDVAADACNWLRSHPKMAGVTISGDVMEYEASQTSLEIYREGGRIDGVFDYPVLFCMVRTDQYDEGFDVAQAARSLLLSSPRHLDNVVGAEEYTGLSRTSDPITNFLSWSWSVALTRRGVESP